MTQANTVDKWAKAEKLAAKVGPRMKALMDRLAERFGETAWEDDCDNVAGFGFEVSRYAGDENPLGVTFEIWDSGDADDGVYGVHGNFVLDIVEYGGAIVGGITPENYTDGVWVDYEGADEEWERRLAGIERAEDAIAECIEEWR
ncbi:MAG: hypothetical protein WC657_07010, partial [Candidatus Paceibacterota bacterium]